MHFECKTKAEKAWLVASVAAFVLHRLLEVGPDAGGMFLVEWLMIALSFPCGPVAMIFILIGVEGLSDYADLSWLLDWSTLLFVGYVQWFWVLPEIRRNSQPLTLSLQQPVETTSPDAASTLLTAAPILFNAATFVPPLAEFDEAGLTALERVLQTQAPPPTTQLPLSPIALNLPSSH